MTKKFLRFLFIGGGTFFIYAGIQKLLSLASMELYVSVSIAYIVAITYHYFGNNYFTFRDGKRAIHHIKLSKYFLVNAVNYLINIFCVAIGRQLGMPVMASMIVAVGITTVTGFLIYDRWVFREEYE